MRPFNLEEAKAGKPVCTRGGLKARMICFDRANEYGYRNIALVSISPHRELDCYYTDDGTETNGVESYYDLFMAED